MKTTNLTKERYVTLTPGRWFLAKIYPEKEVTLGNGSKDKVCPGTVYAQGGGNIPAAESWLDLMMQTQPLAAWFPLNKDLQELTTDHPGGCYAMVQFVNKESIKGGRTYNVWQVIHIELEQAEIDTLSGKE